MTKKSTQITKDQYDRLMAAIKTKDEKKKVKEINDDIPKPPQWARENNKVETLTDKEKEKIPVITESDKIENKTWRKKIGRKFRRKLKKNPETSFLVSIRFSNGTKKSLVVVTTQELFIYRKRYYHLRYEDAVLNLNLNLFELVYDEDFVEPLGREIIKKGEKAFFAVSPDNVKPLIDMNYVKVLVESQDIQKLLKLGLFLAMINAVLLLFLVFFQLKDSGIIKF